MDKTKEVEKKKLVFDADSEQRVEMDRIDNGKRYAIAHIFHPVLDEEYFEYAKRQKHVQKVSGTDKVQITSEDDNLRASDWLWKELIIKREGYKERENWKDNVLLQEKHAAINGLLATHIPNADEAIVDAEEGELIDEEQNFTETVVVLQCAYNAWVIDTRHYFAFPSAREVEQYEAIKRRSTSVGGRVGGVFKTQASASIYTNSQAKALADLYDKLIEKTEGYKGRVPAYHKEVAVSQVFANEIEAREKK
jgi:hypothetical protein